MRYEHGDSEAKWTLQAIYNYYNTGLSFCWSSHEGTSLARCSVHLPHSSFFPSYHQNMHSKQWVPWNARNRYVERSVDPLISIDEKPETSCSSDIHARSRPINAVKCALTTDGSHDAGYGWTARSARNATSRISASTSRSRNGRSTPCPWSYLVRFSFRETWTAEQAVEVRDFAFQPEASFWVKRRSVELCWIR